MFQYNSKQWKDQVDDRHLWCTANDYILDPHIFRNVSVLAHKVNHNISVILVYTAGENASFR